jgi:type IV pilus assembly protein PilM
LETDVGLFAMKRDQVARALKPLEDVGIEVDIIQLAPLSIYNFVCFDRLKLEGAYDPANPPLSTVVISLGTDTTDLVITNGYRVWQRNIPIGGNHFTKSLTKELKLTFAKAEHLKRNAMRAENPKAVFQAMRPVFSDLVAEIQRSIGFFTSNNRNAKLGNIVALGNPMKLPGLQRFLAQNLDQEVQLIDQFNGLVGGTATASPQYKENVLTFGVAYGLCVQALGESQIRTNLLPDELLTTRLVRAKKPWAVAANAALLAFMTINFASHHQAWTTANTEDPTMKQAMQDVASLQSEVQSAKTTHESYVAKFDELAKIGTNLQSNVDGRLLWLEMLNGFNAALPKDPRPPEERKQTPADVSMRPELHITRMDCEFVPELKAWFDTVKDKFEPVTPAAAPAKAAADAVATAAAPAQEESDTQPPAANAAPADGTTPSDAPAAAEGDPAAAGPSGPGWVIEIEGHHYHNALPDAPPIKVSDGGEDRAFLINTFCHDLQTGTVKLPDGQNGAEIEVPIASLGLGYPVILSKGKANPVQMSPLADESASAPGGGLGRGTYMPRTPFGRDDGSGMPPDAGPEIWKLRRYDFKIQFCWKQEPRGQRLEKLAKQPGSVPTTARLDNK